MSTPTAQVVSVEDLDSKDAKWLNLVKINYKDASGQMRTWEAMKRPTRPKNSAVDAIQLIAILEKPTGPELLLEKQFRPPTNKVVIELPAGLVDEGETPEQAAVRELREETGYVGETMPEEGGKRTLLWNSPASSSSCSYCIHVKIDLTKEENQNPKPQLEDGEFIECFSVPLQHLFTELRKLNDGGFAIDGKVAAIAEGIEMSKAWKN